MPTITSTMTSTPPASSLLAPADTFIRRHIGPCDAEVVEMLGVIGCASLEELAAQAIPSAIRMARPLSIEDPTKPAGAAARGEAETLAALQRIAQQNEAWATWIGMGYTGTIVPGVIQRNILENPGWYTAYTPYQAEIAQGRLEALLNFQTMIAELTGLPLAGASLLDEGTAVAEAMTMCRSIAAATHDRFFVDAACHPQTIAVVQTRAAGLGISVVVGDPATMDFSATACCGAVLAYPATDGTVHDFRSAADRIHAGGGQVVACCDPMALVMLVPPGQWGADIAVGSAQRFGVPMGFGGPHAAFIATKPEHVRRMPGRLIGVSRDATGAPALRMAIQTREQHIKRDRATSNICTAQVLLAVMAGMYGVYHGPDGLRRIAARIHGATSALAAALGRLGHTVLNDTWFDTLHIRLAGSPGGFASALGARRINVRHFADGTVGVTLDETVTMASLESLLGAFAAAVGKPAPALEVPAGPTVPSSLLRTDAFMTQDVFNTCHSEHELLRYIKRLESRDLSLCHSMIPLGSCTMKLNGTSEMAPVTWPEFANIHPFAPSDQWRGYATMFRQLESWLAEITGFSAVSLQPNAGSQGEYAGLMVIRAYHAHRGEAHRTICLIPESAHGTNPASAVVAGMKVVPIACLPNGEIDLADLSARATEHAANLAAVMITYPSTHGVFEVSVREACAIVHGHGGLVYMDGANMNAQVGLARPGDIGADVCHLNLHKTFCIPHGGGGPGMGPIGVNDRLKAYLPGHPIANPASAGVHAIGPISAAPYGSASILPISWMYIALMGGAGLTFATEVAILAANYMATRLQEHFPVRYVNANGRCAHEFIIDCNAFDKSAGIKVDDIAKRLMDYGFHAPTMSWPEPGMLMIEPTESESKPELDRLCDALISIRAEIRAIEEGRMPRDSNPLKHAPHTAAVVGGDAWNRPYSREQAAWPAPWLKDHKFWPSVSRVDNPFGDRNLVCTCDSVRAHA